MFIFSSCFTFFLGGGEVNYLNKIVIIPLVNYVEYLLKISEVFFNFFLLNKCKKKNRLSNIYFNFYI